MNDELRNATERLDRIEHELRRHESIMSKIIRVIAPLRRKRRRITKPSIHLTGDQVVSLRAEMKQHGMDDESTCDTRGRRV